MPVQMVCDSTSLVSAALRDALPSTAGGGGGGPSNGINTATSGFLEPDEDIDRIESNLAVAIKRNQLRPIRYEEVPGFGQELDNLKSKYTVLKTTSNSTAAATSSEKTVNGGLMNGSMAKPTSDGSTLQNGAGKDQLPVPKRVLYPRESVQIGWKATGRKWQTGAGMTNVGNTCYLNSTLQALFHVPAIANWLISDVAHRERCDDNNGQGGCIICAMAKTLLASQSSNQGAIKPYLVYSKLRLVCKHLVLGRQEDAHEFLRYLVEAMEKSYLARFKNSKEFDQLTKETTPLNQILGGYLRSEVKCLSCQHVSTTFQHFEDLLLDIRKANSVEDALDVYFARERLEENQYKCEACKKRVAATKQFSLERAPFALCIQLKRFSMMGGKINKHVELRNRLDLSPYCKTGKLTYRLVSMVTHLGNTQHCGHYTAIGCTESGSYYVFDDSFVRPISMQNVTSTNAYIIFYELESVQNGIKSTASSTATSASYAASTSTTGSGSSSSTTKQLGSNSNNSANPTTSSPLRVLGPSNNPSHNPLLPSKLENRPAFIGPMLPGQQPPATQEKAPKKLANGLTNSHIHFPDSAPAPSSPVSSTTSSLSSPSPVKQSRPTTLPQSPKKPNAATASSSTPTKNRFGMTITNGLASPQQSSSSNGSTFKPSTTTTTTTVPPQLPSMPKLCNSPAAGKNGSDGASSVGINNGGSSSSSKSTNGKAVRLVPYDDGDDEEDDDDDEDEEDDERKQRRNGSANGHRGLKEHDSDEDEERLHPSAKHHPNTATTTTVAGDEDDSSCSPKSPPVIKSKTGLWKVSDIRPSSSSGSSSSSANSSKNPSPATSGNSSPANYQNHNGSSTAAATNGRTTTNGGGPLASGYQPNGGARQNSYQQQQQQQQFQGNAFNGYSRNGAAGGGDVVQQLKNFSHRGYGAPVRSWNGQQTHMDRELALERREDRKRQMEDDRETEMDRGRTKKVKTHFYNGNQQHQQRDGNPFQNYQNNQMNGGGGGGMNNNNNRKWNNNNGYNGGGKFFQNNRNNYYGNGNGNYHRNQNGFRNGGRGRNGFFNKSYNHHQRDNVGTSNGYHGGR